MGIHFESRAKEEDVPYEEEAQANGRQGFEGRQLPMQMPSLRRSQAHALPVHELHET